MAEPIPGPGPARNRSGHELTGDMRDFLGRQTYATLATHNADGSMHVVPVVCRFDGQRFQMTDEGLAVVGAHMAGIEDVTIAVSPSAWQAWSLDSDYLPALAEAGIPLDDLGRFFVV